MWIARKRHSNPSVKTVQVAGASQPESTSPSTVTSPNDYLQSDKTSHSNKIVVGPGEDNLPFSRDSTTIRERVTGSCEDFKPLRKSSSVSSTTSLEYKPDKTDTTPNVSSNESGGKRLDIDLVNDTSSGIHNKDHLISRSRSRSYNPAFLKGLTKKINIKGLRNSKALEGFHIRLKWPSSSYFKVTSTSATNSTDAVDTKSRVSNSFDGNEQEDSIVNDISRQVSKLGYSSSCPTSPEKSSLISPSSACSVTPSREKASSQLEPHIWASNTNVKDSFNFVTKKPYTIDVKNSASNSFDRREQEESVGNDISQVPNLGYSSSCPTSPEKIRFFTPSIFNIGPSQIKASNQVVPHIWPSSTSVKVSPNFLTKSNSTGIVDRDTLQKKDYFLDFGSTTLEKLDSDSNSLISFDEIKDSLWTPNTISSSSSPVSPDQVFMSPSFVSSVSPPQTSVSSRDPTREVSSTPSSPTTGLNLSLSKADRVVSPTPMTVLSTDSSIGVNPTPTRANRGVSPSLTRATRGISLTPTRATRGVSPTPTRVSNTHYNKGINPGFSLGPTKNTYTTSTIQVNQSPTSISSVDSTNETSPPAMSSKEDCSNLTRALKEVHSNPTEVVARREFTSKLTKVTRGVSPARTKASRGVSPNPTSISSVLSTKNTSTTPTITTKEVNLTSGVGSTPSSMPSVSPTLSKENAWLSPTPTTSTRGVNAIPTRATRGVSPTPIIVNRGIGSTHSRPTRGVSLTPSTTTRVNQTPTRPTRGVSATPSTISIISSPTIVDSTPRNINLASKRGISPIQIRTPDPPTPKAPRAASPTPFRPSSPMRESSKSTNDFSFDIDIKKLNKDSNHAEDIHQLRLLDNVHLQWRYANAKADKLLYKHKVATEKKLHSLWSTNSELFGIVAEKKIEIEELKLKLKLYSILYNQIIYLKEWTSIEKSHAAILSKSIQDIQKTTLSLPVVGGARVNIHSLKGAICSAVDLMQRIRSSISFSLLRVEGMNALVSELARVSGEERSVLEECEALFSTADLMQVEEYSLRAQLVQFNQAFKDEEL